MLNDEQITFYRQNGYVAVEDVLSEDDVDDLRRVTDEFIERSRLLIKGGEIFDLGPDHTADRPQVRRINAPWKHHSVYDRTLRHEGVLDIVDQLIGPGLRLRGGKLNMKSEDRASQVEWHQDWAFFPHTNDDLLTVGVAIDDMDATNGCLQVIPGSHRDRLYDHHQDGYFVGAVAEPDFDDSTAVPVEVQAGGLSIHHVRTLHGSLPSASGRPRRLLLFTHGALDAWPLMGGTGSRSGRPSSEASSRMRSGSRRCRRASRFPDINEREPSMRFKAGWSKRLLEKFSRKGVRKKKQEGGFGYLAAFLCGLFYAVDTG